MVRIRINKGVTASDLLDRGYTLVNSKSGVYYQKFIGSGREYEVQVKLTYPNNLRIQNWADSRAPWILLKFILGVEEGLDAGGRIKITDSDRYKILKVKETKELIEELGKFTDVDKRLKKWYQEYVNGTLKLQ